MSDYTVYICNAFGTCAAVYCRTIYNAFDTCAAVFALFLYKLSVSAHRSHSFSMMGKAGYPAAPMKQPPVPYWLWLRQRRNMPALIEDAPPQAAAGSELRRSFSDPVVNCDTTLTVSELLACRDAATTRLGCRDAATTRSCPRTMSCPAIVSRAPRHVRFVDV